MARHERYLHTPGIATGLELTVDNSTGVMRREDGGRAWRSTSPAGRSSSIARRRSPPRTSTARASLTPPDTDPALEQEDRPWHPVFLTGRRRERDAALVRARLRQRRAAQPHGRGVRHQLRPSPETTGDEPVAVEISDGPSADTAVARAGRVRAVGRRLELRRREVGRARGGSEPRPSPSYAGARADEVVARSGTLALRADQGATATSGRRWCWTARTAAGCASACRTRAARSTPSSA